ncbi:MAG: hypothetical protein ACRDKY_01445 [Solirubrobacteraceae bacterium]
MARERVVVTVGPRTVLMVVGILPAVAATVWLVIVAERVLIWTLVSLFLALALDPAVECFQRHGLRRRGAAVAVVYLAVTAVIVGMGALTKGRGPLGFLEREYNVVERVEKAVDGGGGGGALAGGASAALDVTRSVVTFIAGVLTITFLGICAGPKARASRDLRSVLELALDPAADDVARRAT